jgi:ankyrin repeat protein
MKSVDAGIFFDEMMADLSDGNLDRKSEMVQFFTRYDTNPNPTKTTVMQTWLNYVLADACQKGHLNVVQFVLTSKELPLHAEINFNKGILSRACEKGQLHVIKYLLTSSELKEHADIHARDDMPLRAACRTGNLDIVKYLTSSPELKENANIYANKGEPFIDAFQHGHSEILKHLIFDLKMEITTDIDDFLASTFLTDLKEQVYEWVKVSRFKDLVEDLPINEEKNKVRVKL